MSSGRGRLLRRSATAAFAATAPHGARIGWWQTTSRSRCPWAPGYWWSPTSVWALWRPTSRRGAAGEVARAIAAWSGPGSWWWPATCSTSTADGEIGSTRKRLRPMGASGDALGSFACRAGRRVVVLPGRRDPWLTSSPATAELCLRAPGPKSRPRWWSSCTPRQVPAPCASSPGTASSRRRAGQPRQRGYQRRRPTPRRQRLADVLPGVWRGSTSGWLAGHERARRPRRRVPLRGLAPRVPPVRPAGVAAGRSRRGALLARFLSPSYGRLATSPASLLTTALVGPPALELVVLVALAAGLPPPGVVGVLRQGRRPRDLNEAGRAAARELVADGLGGPGDRRHMPGRAEPARGTAFTPTPVAAPRW